MLFTECNIIRICAVECLKCLFQNWKAHLIETFVVHFVRAAPVGICVIGVFEQTLFFKLFKVDEIWISGISGKRLVRRIAVASRRERKNLPDRNTAFFQKVRKLISGCTVCRCRSERAGWRCALKCHFFSWIKFLSFYIVYHKVAWSILRDRMW